MKQDVVVVAVSRAAGDVVSCSAGDWILRDVVNVFVRAGIVEGFEGGEWGAWVEV